MVELWEGSFLVLVLEHSNPIKFASLLSLGPWSAAHSKMALDLKFEEVVGDGLPPHGGTVNFFTGLMCGTSNDAKAHCTTICIR
jgi:hypothetical protein